MKRSSISSPLFQQGFTLQQINSMVAGTLCEQLAIRFTELGDDFLKGTMPVDHRTCQPMGLLHGGASVALAETLGSVASSMCLNRETQYSVGLEINANHVKGIKKGFVTGVARPIHIGKKTHVWAIQITNEGNELISISRITMAVIDKRPLSAP